MWVAIHQYTVCTPSSQGHVTISKDNECRKFIWIWRRKRCSLKSKSLPVDSCFTAWSAVDWRQAPFWSPVWRMYWRIVNSVQDTIVKDRRRTTRHVVRCLKLSYGTTYTISDILGYSKVAHARWVKRMLTADITHIRTQTSRSNLDLYNQIMSSFFVDMWPWMRPVLTISIQKWNDKLCSGSTQPHIQWSRFERPHRPQGYGVCILG